MFPLDPMLLMFLKFFVVVTCIVFWLRLGIRYLTRGYRIDSSYYRHGTRSRRRPHSRNRGNSDD